MAGVDAILQDMEAGKEIRFRDLFKVCEHYFGQSRNAGGSHYVFKMPWPGDPRVNIQNDKGRAKPYQVRQVLSAVAKLTEVSATHPLKQTTSLTGALSGRKPAKRR
jgi:hypothetical protein